MEDDPKPKRKETTPYHIAAVSAFRGLLCENLHNGDVTITDEFPLSKDPLRIDIIIIKKNRDVKLKTAIGKLFREHNIVEYKSPADAALSLPVFDKTVHGYAGIYASQSDVKLTDMSVTIVCCKKPVKLFKTLEKEFNYKVLRKGNGIYYIVLDGVAAEKTLAIQIVVNTELGDSELPLKSVRRGVSGAEYKKLVKFAEKCKKYSISLTTLLETVYHSNYKILEKELDMNTKSKLYQEFERCVFIAKTERKARMEGKLEGMQRGKMEGIKKVFSLLENGCSLDEAKKKLQLA